MMEAKVGGCQIWLNFSALVSNVHNMQIEALTNLCYIDQSHPQSEFVALPLLWDE